MTGTQSGSPDSALDQPMMIVDEDTYPPPDRAHAPPIPPMVRIEIRGTGPLEEGDAIVGGAWDEDEEEVEREGPAELVIEEELQEEERPWEGAIAQVVYHAGKLLGAKLNISEVCLVVREAYHLWGRVATREQTMAWGEENHPGLSVTTELEGYARTHAQEVRDAGGFEEAVRRKFTETLPNRLNPDRVRKTLSRSNPEFDRMMVLANGIVAPLAGGFEPVGVPPPKTTLYTQVSKAVDGQFLKQVKEGLVMVLPLSVAETIQGIHFSAPH